MAYIVECNNRETISIPFGAIDLPPSPFGPPAVADEEQKWFTASDGCAGSGLPGTLRSLDRRSLFTGSVVDLEVAYLIPPPTDGEESSRAQVVGSAASRSTGINDPPIAQESLCNSLKLGGNDDTFRLDGLMNTFLCASLLCILKENAAHECSGILASRTSGRLRYIHDPFAITGVRPSLRSAQKGQRTLGRKSKA